MDNKQLIIAEHILFTEDKPDRIVKKGKDFLVYWSDGLILRRDTYTICKVNGTASALLERCEQRYSYQDKWFEV